MARTVEDVALLLSAMAGPDRRSPIAIAEPGARFRAPLGRDFSGVRIAWSRDLGGLPVDRRVTAVLDAQRATFEALGCARRGRRSPTCTDARRDLPGVARLELRGALRAAARRSIATR